MTRLTIALLAGALLTAPATAMVPAGDPAAAARAFIDAFNTGDAKAIAAGYADGDKAITDEFAPHLWTGPKADQAWMADYARNAKATGVSDGKVSYGKPTRVEVEGSAAYVILPTVYTYKAHGKPTAEEGQMTFVLKSGPSGWKMRGWTWSGVKPHPAK